MLTPIFLLAAIGEVICMEATYNYQSNIRYDRWNPENPQTPKQLSHARIVQGPRDVAVLEGDDALFFCVVEGNPEPTVTFLLDGQLGRLSADIGKVMHIPGSEGSRFLRLFKVSSKQSRTKVECLASNHVGNDRASASLLVYKYTDKVPLGFPKFIRSPKSETAQVGRRVQLDCEAEGDGGMSFLWLKNGLPVRLLPQSAASDGFNPPVDYSSSSRGGATAQLPLRIDNLEASDDAYYECLVSNKHGSTMSPNGHLTVKDTFYPPVILEQQERVEVRPGKGANLTCTATGNPKPELRWLTDREKPLTEAVEWKAMLFLTDVTEPRIYVCVANNSLGRVQHAVRVDIIDVPSAPASLECLSRGPTHAILRWFSGQPDVREGMSPGGPRIPITSYTLIVTELDTMQGGPPNKKKLVDISPWKVEPDGSLHLKVTDLKPDHRYTAEVYAVSSEFGASDSSNQVKFKTLEATPSGPPEAIQAIVTSKDSISVTWKPPTEPNGKITGYKLYYSTHLRTQLTQWQVTQTTQTHSTIRGLTQGSTYYLKIGAFNLAGDGPVSEAHPIIVSSGVPPRPLNFRGISPSPTAIQLIWSPPKLSPGMEILDYHLRCRPASEVQGDHVLDSPNAKRIPPQNTSWAIKALRPDTLYQVWLTARTKHGQGLPAILKIRTMSNVPTQPQELTLDSCQTASAVAGGNVQADYPILKLTWKPPHQTYGELKGYQVSFRLVGPPELLLSTSKVDGEEKFLDANGHVIPTHAVRRNVTGTSYTSTQIDNIQFGRNYHFEVAAYNNIDIGVPAYLNVTTPENAPGSFPLHLRVRGLSANAVELSWSPPSKEARNGRIIGYQVHFYVFNSPQSTANFQNTTQPLLRIDGLQERTVYTFRVRAFTASGPGPWSASNTIKTTAEVPDPPTQFKAQRINQRQIKVTWKLPRRSGQSLLGYHQRPIPVTGFRIYYAIDDNIIDPSNEKILEVGAVTMATLDDVSPSESYVIKIQSRGADKRFGNWSGPIKVNANRYGIDQIGGGYPLIKVSDLRCFSAKAKIDENSGEASLTVTWFPPADQRMLKEYEIRIKGVKSYINEVNDPVGLSLSPRKLVVSPTEMSGHVGGGVHGSRNEFLTGDPDMPYVHTIDDLEPNAVMDIEVRPIYDDVIGRQIRDSEGLWEQTSCRTKMLPPANMSAPLPVAFKKETKEVIMRLARVSENLGPIRRYFLLLSTQERAAFLTNAGRVNWHSELIRMISTQAPDTRVAAEFTQISFESSQVDIPIGGRMFENRGEMRRFRRSSPNVSRRMMLSDAAATSATHPNRDGEILLHDCPLVEGQRYRAFLLACIYADVQFAAILPKHSQPSGYQPRYGNPHVPPTTPPASPDGVTEVEEDEDSISPHLCAASPWSMTFTSEETVVVPGEETGVSGLTEVGTGYNTGITRAGPSFFTIILVTVIIGLGLVALVCIGVQCFFRRRPKQQRSSIGSKLSSAETSLKTPLMPPIVAVAPSIDALELNPIEFNISKVAVPAPSAALNLSHCNTIAQHASKPFDNGSNQTPLQPNGDTIARQTPQPIPGQSPISLDHLAQHVLNLKSFENHGLYKECEAIEPTGNFTWHHANIELNKPKNRYANVIAYDHSRVILKQIPGVPCSDYINANYVDGYRRKNAYIATQGPLPETFSDFWRMVWEQNSSIIVMMTKLEERSRLKCDQYWPTRGTEVYNIGLPGDQKPTDYAALSVTLLESVEYAYYTIRTFSLQKMTLPTAVGSLQRRGGYTNGAMVSETRQVKQFQYTAWPNCGAPEQPQPLLLFIRQVSRARSILVQQRRPENGAVPGPSVADSAPLKISDGPTVVHCSAGVGRTGAFIVIDSQLERMKAESTIDILGTVIRMRTQRNFMVQTEQQYAFLYEALVEAAQLAGSEVSANGLYNYVMKLRQPAPTSMLNHYLGDLGNGPLAKSNLPPNMTALELEFLRVTTNLKVLGQCTSALLPDNRNKNRADSVLPFENNRVVLSTIYGVDGADYINASFVNGYWSQGAYIATQAPLASTAKDFWRMLWEHNSPIIVMLSQLTENSKEQSFQYWPSERSQRYQNFLVEPMVEYNMPSFLLREFRLTDTRDAQSKTLRQFQFTDWPENGTPMSQAAEKLIDLISQVHKTQAQFGQDGPITVHCSAGAGRTGIFIVLSILLERMRCEGVVDLLLTARLLREQRSQMIETESQYAFCYTALLEYLASFEH